MASIASPSVMRSDSVTRPPGTGHGDPSEEKSSLRASTSAGVGAQRSAASHTGGHDEFTTRGRSRSITSAPDAQSAEVAAVAAADPVSVVLANVRTLGVACVCLGVGGLLGVRAALQVWPAGAVAATGGPASALLTSSMTSTTASDAERGPRALFTRSMLEKVLASACALGTGIVGATLALGAGVTEAHARRLAALDVLLSPRGPAPSVVAAGHATTPSAPLSGHTHAHTRTLALPQVHPPTPPAASAVPILRDVTSGLSTLASNPVGGPVIVGVAGASGSGKTSIAELIAMQLRPTRVVALSCDNYYKTMPEGVDAEDYNFDHPASIDFQLLSTHLRQLREGHDVHVPHYDFKTHMRTEETTLVSADETEVLILDGIFVLWAEEVRQQCDLTIFTVEDSDVCLARRIRRDIVARGRTVESVLLQYLKFVKAGYTQFVAPSMMQADLIIPRARENVVAIQLLASDIKRRVGRPLESS